MARNSACLTRLSKGSLLTGSAVAALFSMGTAFAQDEDEDVVVVRGVRATVQNSIEAKRENNSIVEALSSDDIGDLPALSIGEALETLTSAASHREQGGATEISVRGLGPYLGSTVVNGREASNGSGDRSVNFSQFPSELFNKLEVYKTQEARLIEGGVSGQISLSTIKPIEYGKRRVQAEFKGNYNPDNYDLEDPIDDLGYRGTLSFVDNWETENAGRFGISVGYQTNQTSNPEQEARTSSGFRDCRNVVSGDPDSDDFGVDSLGDTDQNCDSGGGDLVLEVDPTTGVAPDADTPFVLVSSQRHFRQNVTDDDRKSVFLAGQWQPTDAWDINVDFQSSDRTFTEYRSDLTIDGNSLLNLGEDGEIVPLSVAPSGALLGATIFDGAEVSSQFVQRIEEYEGGGISVAYDLTDNLNISADWSTSKTQRVENILQSRLRSDTDGDSGSEDVAVGVIVDGDHHRFIFRDFDVTNPDNFDAGPRVREDLNQFRNDKVTAFRADFDYNMDGDFISSVQGGVRHSTREYDSVPRVRVETDGSPNAVGDGEVANALCRQDFPESDFLGSLSNGPLITNIDANGDVIASGTGASWVSFDPICLAESLLGRAYSIPDAADGRESTTAVDVEEETLAAYVQANYAGTWGDKPVRGNFGVRVVDTEVTSNGFRSDFTVTRDAEGLVTDLVSTGDLTAIEATHSYTRWLPSANLVMDLQDDVLFRAGIFRAMSRADPSDLGLGRTFSIGDNDGVAGDIADFVSGVNGSGNPEIDPLMSWNYDAAVEWYPNEDTILALGVYYKSFQGGFQQVGQVETFNVDGTDFDAIVVKSDLDDEESTITGFEMTAAHTMSYLPGAWSGLGFKLSYNYADSDFEFEDAVFGAATIINSDGSTTERVGIVEPANVPGLSEHVFSGQVYYSIGNLDLQGVYKHRSEYFQQFISTPGNLRYIGDVGVYEARASYQITDNVRFSLEGINLFNEPKTQYNPTRDSFAEVNVYGPRIFAGIRAKF